MFPKIYTIHDRYQTEINHKPAPSAVFNVLPYLIFDHFLMLSVSQEA